MQLVATTHKSVMPLKPQHHNIHGVGEILCSSRSIQPYIVQRVCSSTFLKEFVGYIIINNNIENTFKFIFRKRQFKRIGSIGFFNFIDRKGSHAHAQNFSPILIYSLSFITYSYAGILEVNSKVFTNTEISYRSNEFS